MKKPEQVGKWESGLVRVRERPIIFSAPMVRAILDGTKTETRRVVKGVALQALSAATEHAMPPCPYGQPGERLWVKETHQVCPECIHIEYAADANRGNCRHCDASLGRWRPSIFMSRAYARLTLEIVGVRVERLQDITDEGAIAEGVDEYRRAHCSKSNPRGFGVVDYYQLLWESIHGPGSWDANPWVWVVTFNRVTK